MHECQSRDYFQRRASEESAAAKKATDERAAQSHRELSDRYRNLASGTEQLAGDDAGTCGDGILSKDFRIVP
jgi:hypothetical protein